MTVFQNKGKAQKLKFNKRMENITGKRQTMKSNQEVRQHPWLCQGLCFLCCPILLPRPWPCHSVSLVVQLPHVIKISAPTANVCVHACVRVQTNAVMLEFISPVLSRLLRWVSSGAAHLSATRPPFIPRLAEKWEQLFQIKPWKTPAITLCGLSYLFNVRI